MKLPIVVACLAIVSAGAFAQHKMTKMAPKSNDKAMFEAMYKEAEKAFETKDAKGLMKGMTPDFTETSMGKTENADNSMKGLRQFLGMFSTVHCTFKMTGYKVNGNTATTMDKVHVWGMSKPDPKTHKSGKIDASRDETFTWTKMGGHWMVKNISATNEKMLLNGKPMPMGPPK